MADDLRDSALEYHRVPTPGKIQVVPTKPLANQRDLALAYSPGVAAASEAIAANPDEARALTIRGNLIGVVTNGTAVLGLGNIGPLAAKPVMEGKGVLFKKFAGIDVFDIEVDAGDPKRMIEVVAALEPTFGGINLEDIKAPECFEVEKALRERMSIPVFHDDQHGTAIIVSAAVTNALAIVGKPIESVRLVASGAGAAALACLDLLVSLGLDPKNVTVTDLVGVVHAGRKKEMDPYKARYAQNTKARRLIEAIEGADIFLGLSAGGVLSAEMVERMADKPIIFALANPTPEIMPEEARAVRADAIIATGRSDYPNQVNNVLCFPFIFRGALDVGATTINEAMKHACVGALAALARAESSDIAAAAYGRKPLKFGPDYLIPKPFDPRLILELAPAVAKAAMDSGVATRPIEDFEAYRQRLTQFVFRSGQVMRPVFDRAREDPRRLVYAEGEDERVLRAAQTVIDEGLARPILIGRRDVVSARIERLGLRLRSDVDFELVDPQADSRFRDYWSEYHSIMERDGITPDDARTVVRTRTTVIAALMLRREEADAMICGTTGQYDRHLRHILDVIGLAKGVKNASALSLVILPSGTYFLCDTYVSPDPGPAEIAEMTMLAGRAVRRFGIEPKVALLSHSDFGSRDTPSSRKMREALRIIMAQEPDFEVEGEMNAAAALDEKVRRRLFPNARLKGPANLMIMPNLDAANIAFGLVNGLGDGVTVGPMLIGAARPAHVLTPAVTVRGVINMSALAVVHSNARVKKAKR